jgi:hypothetical protein
MQKKVFLYNNKKKRKNCEKSLTENNNKKKTFLIEKLICLWEKSFFSILPHRNKKKINKVLQMQIKVERK